MYHKISDRTCDALTVRQRDFAAQLHWLAQNGYTPISFAELIAYHLHQTNLPQKPIILSFDDNYHNNFVLAYPLLKQLGIAKPEEQKKEQKDPKKGRRR
jgi:peptidoglycan/xylan/chitin deacetylase (PgdA/CDA1 family)